MKAPVTTAMAVVVAASAAFFAGRATAPSAASGDSSASSAPGTEERATTRSGTASSEAERARRTREGAASENWDAAAEEMRLILTGSDPLSRTQAWLDFINTLDPDQFTAIVEQFREGGFNESNRAEYELLLTAWAKLDPLSAIAYAEENTGGRFARQTILETWATVDPMSAIAWAREHHDDPNDGNPWMVGVIRGLAQTDPALATQLTMEMPRSRERGDALSTLMPVMLAQGADVAKGWVESLTDESLKDGAIRILSEDLARTNPADAANWLAANPGEASNRSIDEVMGTWADRNSEEALAFYYQLPEGDTRTNALRGLTNSMALDDPRAAADFLDQHAADANDNVYQQFVWHSFRGDPSLAANYIGRIEDPRQRDGMYRRMLDGWLRRDYDAAVGWMSSNELPADVANHMERRITEIQNRQR